MVDGPLGVAARRDQGSRVGGQDGQPVPEVGGVVVAGGLLEPELCAPERCAELGDEFFGAVAAIAEPTREVASET